MQVKRTKRAGVDVHKDVWQNTMLYVCNVMIGEAWRMWILTVQYHEVLLLFGWVM